MNGRWVSLSPQRRIIGDMLHFAARMPSIPVQRRMRLGAVAAARARVADRPSWPALFLKGYSLVSAETPALRRAYVTLPWPHLCEYRNTVAGLAVEREYRGEPGVFIGPVWNPNKLSLSDIHARVREYAEQPVWDVAPFRRALLFARLPRPLRRMAFWLGLNIGRYRAGSFGTFALTVYSSLGAESLHPISPLTTTLTYGVIGPDGEVNVRIAYDHRVMDGSVVARALARLEDVLTGAILDELKSMADPKRRAA